MTQTDRLEAPVLRAAAEAGGDSVEDERMRTHASGGFLKAGVPPLAPFTHMSCPPHWLGLKFVTLFQGNLGIAYKQTDLKAKMEEKGGPQGALELKSCLLWSEPR